MKTPPPSIVAVQYENEESETLKECTPSPMYKPPPEDPEQDEKLQLIISGARVFEPM